LVIGIPAHHEFEAVLVLGRSPVAGELALAVKLDVQTETLVYARNPAERSFAGYVGVINALPDVGPADPLARAAYPALNVEAPVALSRTVRNAAEWNRHFHRKAVRLSLGAAFPDGVPFHEIDGIILNKGIDARA